MMHRVKNRGFIRDPLHGYIVFDKVLEKPLIDHVLIQRLRHIRQLQLTYLVYPGATHSRFSHSIGTMHLAGRFAETLLSKIESYEYDGYNPTVLIEAARILGLIHDIGHGPFSHAFDESVLIQYFNKDPRAANHEAIGRFIYNNFLYNILRSLFENSEYEKAEEVVYSILNDRDTRIVKLIRYVVKDFYYPADLLDFLPRDSYYTGTVEYGFIDINRLIESSHPIQVNRNEYKIALDRKAEGALRGLLQAKVSMFEYVYLHHSNRAFDKLLKKILSNYAVELGLVGAIDELLSGVIDSFSELWDDVVYYKILKIDESRCPSVYYLKRRQSPWKVVYTPLRIPYVKILSSKIINEIKAEFQKIISEKIRFSGDNIEEFWVEMAEIMPIPTTVDLPGGHGGFLFGDRVNGEIEVEEISPQRLSSILGLIPTAHLRLYVRRDVYRSIGENEIKQMVLEASNEITRTLDDKYGLGDLLTAMKRSDLQDHEKVTM